MDELEVFNKILNTWTVVGGMLKDETLKIDVYLGVYLSTECTFPFWKEVCSSLKQDFALLLMKVHLLLENPPKLTTNDKELLQAYLLSEVSKLKTEEEKKIFWESHKNKPYLRVDNKPFGGKNKEDRRPPH